MQQKKNFHRHFATPGLNLYWIIIAYIIVGWFYPVVGLIALICMIGVGNGLVQVTVGDSLCRIC